eukprot:Awhi_evm1s10127
MENRMSTKEYSDKKLHDIFKDRLLEFIEITNNLYDEDEQTILEEKIDKLLKEDNKYQNEYRSKKDNKQYEDILYKTIQYLTCSESDNDIPIKVQEFIHTYLMSMLNMHWYTTQ